MNNNDRFQKIKEHCCYYTIYNQCSRSDNRGATYDNGPVHSGSCTIENCPIVANDEDIWLGVPFSAESNYQEDGLDQFMKTLKYVIRNWGIIELLIVAVFFPWSLVYIGFRMIQEWK